MPKYIVEAPEPKKGETLSSGGIRSNGKIVAQYKNPTPYTEPEPSYALIPVKEQEESFSAKHPVISALGEEAKAELKDMASELWRTEIKPYIIFFLKRTIHSFFTRKKNKQEVIETTYANDQEDNNNSDLDTPIITISKVG